MRNRAPGWLVPVALVGFALPFGLGASSQTHDERYVPHRLMDARPSAPAVGGVATLQVQSVGPGATHAENGFVLDGARLTLADDGDGPAPVPAAGGIVACRGGRHPSPSDEVRAADALSVEGAAPGSVFRVLSGEPGRESVVAARTLE